MGSDGVYASLFAGTNIQTGEEVAIKLVRFLTLIPLLHGFVDGAGLVLVSSDWRPLSLSQESVKTRHPQLLYESKLYKILQGGGESLRRPASE
jgi:hypothetical protein